MSDRSSLSVGESNSDWVQSNHNEVFEINMNSQLKYSFYQHQSTLLYLVHLIHLTIANMRFSTIIPIAVMGLATANPLAIVGNEAL